MLKPSGFSELAWGSRGVSIGHDLPQVEWATALEQALQAFPTTPYVLQEFHKGRLFESAYLDERTDTVVPMSGRARLSPYYFVVGDKAELGGILATLCRSQQKNYSRHGRRDHGALRDGAGLLPRGCSDEPQTCTRTSHARHIHQFHHRYSWH